MNIKFKLEPKIRQAGLPEMKTIVKQIDDSAQAAEQLKSGETKSVEELLYGKEVSLDDLITD